MVNDISAVILAGGDSKRFGGIIKAKILINSEPILKRMTTLLEDIFDEIIIVTNTPAEFNDYNNFKIVRDIFIKKGPLGGIHAALEASSKGAVFVFAGDMPFISRDIIIDQVSHLNTAKYEAIVPQIGTYIEPLHAIYMNSVKESLKAFLSEQNNFAVRDFLRKLNVNYFQVEDNAENRISFTNINSTADLSLFQNEH